MKTTVDRKELIKALKIVKPGLANREIIQQSTHFAFMGDRVVTYNDEISISHPIPFNIRGTLEAGPFLTFLERDNSETIDFEVIGDELILSSSYKAGFVFAKNIPRIFLRTKRRGPWHRLENPLSFFEALEFCGNTCSKDMSRPILTCVHVGDDYMESSDNIQYSWCPVPDPLPVKTFLIPGTTVKELSRYEITHIAESSRGWVHFKSIDGTDFACRIFEDNYPDTTWLKEKITAAEKSYKIMFPADTKQMIDSVSVVLKKIKVKDRVIKVSIGNKKLIMETEGLAGHQSTEASLRYAGDPVSLMVKPNFLQAALKVSRECYIGKDVILFKSHAGVRLIGFVPD